MFLMWLSRFVLLASQVVFAVCEDRAIGNEINKKIANLFDKPFDSAHIHFTVHSPSNDDEWIPVSVHNSSEYLKGVFQHQLETKFIVHGRGESDDTDSVKDIANRYKAISRYNIVKVDWEKYSGSYLQRKKTIKRVPEVGQAVATFINKLSEIGAIELKSLHLIGVNTGAHVMGCAGARIDGRPGRITGLDPTSLGFEVLTHGGNMLDESDGEFVDIIHTSRLLGYRKPHGHVDFYPNHGGPQPGCLKLGCSHFRAYKYFAESISNPKGFRAERCDSWKQYKSGFCTYNSTTYMGSETPVHVRGLYYLETNKKSPFARG